MKKEEDLYPRITSRKKKHTREKNDTGKKLAVSGVAEEKRQSIPGGRNQMILYYLKASFGSWIHISSSNDGVMANSIVLSELPRLKIVPIIQETCALCRQLHLSTHRVTDTHKNIHDKEIDEFEVPCRFHVQCRHVHSHVYCMRSIGNVISLILNLLLD